MFCLLISDILLVNWAVCKLNTGLGLSGLRYLEFLDMLSIYIELTAWPFLREIAREHWPSKDLSIRRLSPLEYPLNNGESRFKGESGTFPDIPESSILKSGEVLSLISL